MENEHRKPPIESTESQQEEEVEKKAAHVQNTLCKLDL